MTRFQMVAAACIFLFGLLIGLVGRSDRTDLTAFDAVVAARMEALGARVDAAQAAQADQFVLLDAGVAALAERIGSVEAAARAGAETASGAGARVDALAESIAAQIQAANAAQVATLESGLAEIRAQTTQPAPDAPASTPRTIDIAPIVAPDDAAPVDVAPSGAPVDVAPSNAPAGADASAAPVRLGVGHSVDLSDGALEVFVSGIDQTAGTALIVVNGALTELSIGQSAQADAGDAPCSVTLDDIDRGEAVLTQDCSPR